jgi:alpha-beta hydrolase superfamily lysophospholipase
VQERIIGKFPVPQSDAERQLAELTKVTFSSMVPRSESLPSFTNEQLSGLKMPVLVLLGGKDVTMDSEAIKRRFEQHVPRAEVVLYPEARHYLGDQSKPIADFLRRVHSEAPDALRE